MSGTARIFDRRRKDRFWIHDVVIDDYGKDLGAYGIAVYCYLARRADDRGLAFPRIKLIADDLAMSETKVKESLRSLKKCNLLVVEPQYRQDGSRGANNYILIDPDSAGGEASEDPPPAEYDPPPRQNTPSIKEPQSLRNPREGSVEANASSGKPQTSEVIGLEKYITDRIYEAMREAEYRLPNEHFKFHLGRAKDMLSKDNPTDEELEQVPQSFVELWEIRGKADAQAALMELRRQKAREVRISESNQGPATWEPVNPHGEQGTKAKLKPRAAFWYVSAFECDFDTAERLVKSGKTHSEICEQLEAHVA